MDKKVKALVWAECRVGGAIAVWCVLLTAAYLAVCRATMGEYVLRWPGDVAEPAALGTPLLIALLLVLNPNQSGHLVGGFSRHVLWLPVSASVAVAAALAMRTLFVFAASLAVLGMTHMLFQGGPALSLAAVFAAVYLVAQLIDWSRGPVSGLSSALCVATLAALVVYVALHDVVGRYFAGFNASTWASGIALLAVLAVPVYGLSVAAVHAARVGRRIGVPEIWEWPKQIDLGSTTRITRAFASPLTAQLWFDLRRSWYVVPLGTLGLAILAIGVTWLATTPVPDTRAFSGLEEGVPRQTLVLFLFPALVLAAAAHGVQSRVVGLRPSVGKAGYEYLQPLTSAQYAWVRVLSNAAFLLPMAAAIVAVHFAVAGVPFLRDVVPFALRTGAATPREIAWTFVGRGVLVCLLAWPLMAVGTRLIRWTVLAFVAIPILTAGILGFLYAPPRADLRDLIFWFIQSITILICAAAYAHAWNRRIVSTCAVAFWGGVWLLTAWMLHGVLPQAPDGRALTALEMALGALTCLAYAALVPLPYAAVVLDVSRRRHGQTCAQDPAQHRRTADGRPGDATRTALRAAAVIAALAMIWLGWRGEPGYKAHLRAKGWPTTLAELDASYPAAPPDKNAAVLYTALAKQAGSDSSAFYARESERLKQQVTDPDLWVENALWQRVLIVGSARMPDAGPIDKEVWETTERYWAEVTSRVAPGLVQMAAAGPLPSRYPVDLRLGFDAILEHLSRLRALGRESSLDAIHWSLAGDAQRAQESANAILPLQESLANEPLLISQMVRIAILGIGIDAFEYVLDRAPITDADLERTQQRLAQALPPVAERRILDVAMRGECVIGLSTLARVSFREVMQDPFTGHDRAVRAYYPGTLLQALAFPPDNECMLLLRFHDRAMTRAEQPMSWNDRSVPYDTESLFAFAPMTSVLSGSLDHAYGAEWRVRMQLDIAQAAIAAERFRRARGRLPDTLEELVPEYVAAVPRDFYASNAPVRYVRHDDGSFVVYSVGRNGVDDGGFEYEEDEEKERDNHADDLAFSLGGPR